MIRLKDELQIPSLQTDYGMKDGNIENLCKRNVDYYSRKKNEVDKNIMKMIVEGQLDKEESRMNKTKP